MKIGRRIALPMSGSQLRAGGPPPPGRYKWRVTNVELIQQKSWTALSVTRTVVDGPSQNCVVAQIFLLGPDHFQVLRALFDACAVAMEEVLQAEALVGCMHVGTLMQAELHGKAVLQIVDLEPAIDAADGK